MIKHLTSSLIDYDCGVGGGGHKSKFAKLQGIVIPVQLKKIPRMKRKR